MRSLLLLAAAAFALASIPPAAAQEDCTIRETPCPWIVTVDAAGFVGETSWTFTQDEWYTFTVSNLDEESHTVVLSGYQVSVTAPADGDASTPIQFSQSGTFTLTHQRTGKTATLTIVAGDSIDDGATTTSGAGGSGTGGGATGTTTKGSPGLGLAASAAALALAIVAVRRR